MYQDMYERWLAAELDDADLKPELESVKGDDAAIQDRFAVALKFGTAGLRGVIGAGTNRMNIYVVRQATQGLANWVKTQGGSQTVAISYDSRIKSNLFARTAAEVLAANGIKVRIYSALMPVPALSFATRYYNCNAGIMVTASHNPAKYNGYKAYGPDGCQMTDEAADIVYAEIQKTDILTGAKLISFEDGMAQGLIEYVGDDCINALYAAIEARSIRPGICKTAGLKLVYSPLNGSGLVPVTHVLGDIGITDITIVPEQKNPDGNFPTCPYPNPEIKQAFECAINLSKTKKADLLVATDPDCDRLGIAVLDDGEYKLMTGNEVGAMFTEYLLETLTEQNKLPKAPVVVKTIVTSPLISAIAAAHGATTANLLTGFKYIGELVTKLESKNEADRFVVGMEESYGYLRGSHARDKDAVVASMLVCEMASYYKLKGMSLYDFMQSIYKKYGLYLNTLLNFGFEGAAGMKKMAEMMDSLRADGLKNIAGMDVITSSDYEASIETNLKTGEKAKITLPKSNVLAYTLEGGNSVIVRPSGTEPKIKIYITAVGNTRDEAKTVTDKISDDMEKILGIKN